MPRTSSKTQIERFAGKEVDVEEWDIPALMREVSRVFGLEPEQFEALKLDEKNTDEIGDALWALVKASYEEKEKMVGPDLLRRVERDIMLQIVDAQWKDHLYSLDHLKEGIGLRGYGQRDPLVEYKKESFALFQDMKARIEEEMVRYLFWLRPVHERRSAGGAAARGAARHAHHDEQAGRRIGDPRLRGRRRAPPRRASARQARRRAGARSRRGPAATT